MRYRIPSETVTAIRSSRQRGTDLARAVGMPPHRLSGYLHGTTFGARTAQRIRAIGPLVGLDPDACIEPFRDPIFQTESVA
jgi:hypothetical protein